ncbi:MAG: SHD1 domain-containing protein, partial [Prosthecobacter sp.]|nr:SHD1 domain-containing protein [Prosthecobacter sp.]
MKTRLLLPLACTLLATSLLAENEVYRTWTDSQGRKLEATFRGIEDGNVFLQVRNGYVYRLPLDKLSAADQQA